MSPEVLDEILKLMAAALAKAQRYEDCTDLIAEMMVWFHKNAPEYLS